MNNQKFHLSIFALVFSVMFSFLVYTNMINIGKTWVVNHKVTPLGFALALHGGVFVVALVGVWMRHHQWSWRHWLPTPTLTGGKP